MTLTAPATTEPVRDAKAGYCVRCRNGSHQLCASPTDRCGCPYKDHPQRPGPSPVAAAPPVPDPPAPAASTLCGYCRGRNHKACTSATCSCEGPSHPQRPGATPPRVGRPAGTTTSAKVEPVWELVKAAPPAPPPKKPTPAELAQPFLESIVEAGDRDSWRIALFGTAIAATKARKALAEAFPEEWAFTSSRDEEGRPAVFVRWLGPGES